jgi:hypothetical protein
VGQQKNRFSRFFCLDGLEMQTGREACPDSQNEVMVYREAQVGQQKNRFSRFFCLDGLEMQTGREACPDSQNEVMVYREAQVGQQKNIFKALINNNIRAFFIVLAGK